MSLLLAPKMMLLCYYYHYHYYHKATGSVSGLFIDGRSPLGRFLVSASKRTVDSDLLGSSRVLGQKLHSQRVHIDCHYGIRSQKTISTMVTMVLGTEFHNGTIYGPFLGLCLGVRVFAVLRL